MRLGDRACGLSSEQITNVFKRRGLSRLFGRRRDHRADPVVVEALEPAADLGEREVLALEPAD
jgi:hypothetical protein